MNINEEILSDSEKRIKKMLYRSWYRGNKETDKILGGFAKKYIYELSEKELDEFEIILDLQDVDIYDWLSGKKPEPDEMKENGVFQRLYDFKPSVENSV